MKSSQDCASSDRFSLDEVFTPYGGILEVDGEPFHPPSRTAQDHERDRLFRTQGILVVEHFDARECYNDADRVVDRFLEILGKA